MAEHLTSPRVLRELLNRHKIRLHKKLGQNFLVDENILAKIVTVVDPGLEDGILEVGPGVGTLTLPLARRCRSLLAVEIDGRLIPVLQETLAGRDNVTLVQGDILKTDITALCQQAFPDRPLKIAANLPYYLTTPFMFKVLESSLLLCSLTLLVQREAARRMVARPGSKDYGVLSLLTEYHCRASLEFSVPPTVFFPRPEVDSALVSLVPRESPAVSVPQRDLLFQLIRTSFQQRRKTLANSLGETLPGGKAKAREIIAAAGFPLLVRGEDLSLEQFAILTELIYNISGNGTSTRECGENR